MANQIKQLFELQQVELEAEQKQKRLEQIGVELDDREALAQAEAKLEQQKQEMSHLNQEQHDTEWQTEDVLSKAKTISDKLYGGQVKIPKELMGLQKDLEALKLKQRELEDKTLELMTRVEEVKNRIDACKSEVSQETQKWQESQARLKAEQKDLENVVSGLSGRAKNLRSEINSQYVALYDRLRPEKVQAVAKVEQGMCMGCRISLPLSIVQRVRLGEEIVRCPSCARILV